MKGHVGAGDTQDLGTIGTRGHVGPGDMQDQGTQGTREHEVQNLLTVVNYVVQSKGPAALRYGSI